MIKNQSIKRQLNITLALIIAFQSFAIILALLISNVFNLLDAESIRVMNNTTKARAEALNTSIGILANNLETSTSHLENDLQKYSNDNNIVQQDFYKNNEAYDYVSKKSAKTIFSILKNNDVTGAFVVLNGSNSDKTDENAHSCVYIRNMSPGTKGAENYQLELGPVNLTKEFDITAGIRWDLDILKSDDNFKFYDNPIWASEQIKNERRITYGYWSKFENVLSDGSDVICYTLPLLDENGDAYGVIGIEVEISYFSKHYLPYTELIYNNSFYLLGNCADDEFKLNWFVPSGVFAKSYLINQDELVLKQGRNSDIYQTKIDGLEDYSCVITDIKMYNNNSPFLDDSLTLGCFVSTSELKENSQSVTEKLKLSLVFANLFAFLVMFLLSYLFTRKITKLSDYVTNLTPYDDLYFEKTGLSEIDNLTTAIKLFNDRIYNVSQTTSKILKLSLLPIGGYEILDDNKNVILTEYIYALMGVDKSVAISKEKWKEFFEKMIATKLIDYDDVYAYYDDKLKKDLWFRIVEHSDVTGTVGIILDVTREIEENRKLANQLDYDILTGLYSKLAIRRKTEKSFIDNYHKIGAMIFIDLDNLKYINDSFGHEAGDLFIIQASNIFRYFQKFGGLVSRISGDEFAVFLYGFNSKDEVREIIHGLYEYAEEIQPYVVDGNKLRVRFSAGVAWYPDDANTFESLLKLSDFAMYEAKSKDKGQLFEFNKTSFEQKGFLLENIDALNTLLEDKLIEFAFQPIVDAKTGEVYAFEALMRSKMEQFKNPQQIISMANSQSKLAHLERVVISVILETMEENEDIIGDRTIFLNSIPDQMFTANEFEEIRNKYHRFFEKVVVEITELDGGDDEKLNFKVDYLRKQNIKVAIDDYGSGHSNERRILELLPNILKIDLALIQGIHNNLDKQELVRNIVSFSHSKGIKIVAEGIEEVKDLEMVINLDIDYIQGYYLSKPTFYFDDIPQNIKDEIVKFN